MHINNVGVGGALGVNQERVPLVTCDEWVPARRQLTCEPGVRRSTEAIFNSLTGDY